MIIAMHTITSPNMIMNAEPPIPIAVTTTVIKTRAINTNNINNIIFLYLLVFSVIQGNVKYAKKKRPIKAYSSHTAFFVTSHAF